MAGGRERDHAGQVDAGDYARVVSGQGNTDRRPDVLALGTEPPVAEGLGHQRGPQTCPRASGSRARPGRGRGKPETRQRGDHNVEAVPLVTSVGGRVSQQRRQLEQFSKRARPPVREYQRERIGALTPLMHEMDSLATDVGCELSEGIQVPLLSPPVERARPVGHQLLQVTDVSTGRPARVGQRPRPSGAAQPRPQIVQDLGRDLDRKGLRAHHHEPPESGAAPIQPRHTRLG